MIKVKWQEVKGTFRGTTKSLITYLKEHNFDVEKNQNGYSILEKGLANKDNSPRDPAGEIFPGTLTALRTFTLYRNVSERLYKLLNRNSS